MHNLKKIKTIYSRNSGGIKSFYKILNLKKKPKFHQLLLKIFNPITFILSFFNLTSTFTIVSKKRLDMKIFFFVNKNINSATARFRGFFFKFYRK